MIRNIRQSILHRGWSILKTVSFDLKNRNENWTKQEREVYETGDAATVLLYNTRKRTIILTRQFRPATYLNGNKDGLLIEACAGKLDGASAEECIKREITEETGYKVPFVQKIFEAYVGPGAITEIVHFFIAAYNESMKQEPGGGLEEEGEEIEIMELGFETAYEMLARNEFKDAKTIILLQYLRLHEEILLMA